MTEQYETLIKTIDDVIRITTLLSKTCKEKEKFMPAIDRLLDHRNALTKQMQMHNKS